MIQMFLTAPTGVMNCVEEHMTVEVKLRDKNLHVTFSIKSLSQKNCVQVGVMVQSLPHRSLQTDS